MLTLENGNVLKAVKVEKCNTEDVDFGFKKGVDGRLRGEVHLALDLLVPNRCDSAGVI